jgi:hypothetical protein
MGSEFGREVTQIALTLAGIALVALLVSNSGGAVKIIQAAGGTYNDLLRTVTLQSGYGNFAQN